MDDLCVLILAELGNLNSSDPILECGEDVPQRLISQANDLSDLATRNLSIFPFKNIKPCWFRLYADTSLVKAVHVIQNRKPRRGFPNLLDSVANLEVESDNDWIDEAVRLLDMALIMAGGLGREDMIHDLLRHIQIECATKAYHTPLNWPKLNTASPQHNATLPETLPEGVSSLPRIAHPVVRFLRPSLSTFQKHMNIIKSPAILTNTMHHWPAMTKWKSTAHWLEQTIGGRRLVPIETGRSYTDEDWGQKIVPFKVFIERHIFPGSVTEVDPDELEIGYLAQHDLLRQIPSLRREIATPDYCFLDPPPPDPGTPVAVSREKDGLATETRKTSHPSLIAAPPISNPTRPDDGGPEDDDSGEIQQNIWFGPAWTISPLHHDPYHNLLCQIVGKKYVRLYSPHASHRLFPRSQEQIAPHHVEVNKKDGVDLTQDASITGFEEDPEIATIDMSNTSTIDVAAMELSPAEDWDVVYPGISGVPYVECVLEAGEALYIPIGWWHYVRSCSVGISVSFWWA